MSLFEIFIENDDIVEVIKVCKGRMDETCSLKSQRAPCSPRQTHPQVVFLVEFFQGHMRIGERCLYIYS
ncbi:hypothetical protein Gasu2_06220 [Galdieria sulphuraria]|nr:hypothetical protein Gasu2_06220 [Galdieria sulphuraria]